MEDRRQLAAFAVGDIAVLVADVAPASNTTATLVGLNPTTAAQSPSNMIAINGSSMPNALRTSGISTMGYLSRSNDGSLIAFTGYNSTSTSATGNTILARGVGTFNESGAFNLATTYTGTSNKTTRGAGSLDNSNWYIGDQNGLYTNGGSSASPSGDLKSVKAFGGTLYVLQQASTTYTINTITIGSPNTLTALSGLNSSLVMNDFALVSSGKNGATYDVLYLSTSTGITKYSLDVGSGMWNLSGSSTAPGQAFGLAAASLGDNTAALFVTTGSGTTASNKVQRFVDSAGWNQTLSLGAATTLYTASASAVIKGVSLAPDAAPTDLALSNATGSAHTVNAPIGTLSTTDASSSDSFTYALVSGTGSTDNLDFKVVGNQLQVDPAVTNTLDAGTYSVRIRTTDKGGLSFEKAFTITLANPNSAPVATDASITTAEDTPKSGTLSATDADGNTLTYSIVANPGHGSISGFNAATGAYTYTPVADYNGSDSFTFKVNDGTVDSNVGTVSITIAAVNDAPVATDASFETNEDRAQSGTLLATDVDNDALRFSIVSQPQHGSVNITNVSTGAFTYTPDANYHGADSFRFKADDGRADSNAATVSIAVNSVNDAPVATDFSLSTNEDEAKDGMLAAADVDGDTLLYAIVVQPQHGTLSSFNASTGAFTYIPARNYNGSDSFTFKANDGTVDGNVARVSVTVGAVNDAPVANGGSFSTNEDTAKAGTLSATDVDGDVLAYTIVTPPAHGSISGFDASTGDFTYTPAADFNGSDAFTFKATDGSLESDAASFSITVNAVNDPPVAADDTVSTSEDVAKSDSLSATDVEGDSLTFSIITNPSHGSLSSFNSSTGAYTYTPAADFNGDDSFTFQANDGSLDSNVGTITITVGAVNDAPVASDGSLSASEDTDKPGQLVASDVDGDALAYLIVDQPSHGVLSNVDTATGSFNYTSDADYHCSDSFTFKVFDGTVDSDMATISITVSAVNDPPVTQDGTLATSENVPKTGTLVASDVDKDALTYSIVDQPQHGTVLITDTSTGAYSYTPDLNYSGPDSFTFKANDGLVNSNVGTISVTVNPVAVNAPPVASDASLTTDEDTPKAGNLSATDADGDPLTYSIVSDPQHGTLSGFNSATGAFLYTPDENYNGSDSFTFKANDGADDSNTATFSLTVTAVNDAPFTKGGSLLVGEDDSQSGMLTAGDPDGDPLIFVILDQPQHGTLSDFNASTGEYTYTPDADYYGKDAFTYQVSDGQAESNVGVVSIAVTPVNDAPAANDDSLSLNEDGSQSGTLTATDVDGDTLTYAIVEQPQHGALSDFNASTGAYTYTPNADFNGTDSFTFKANDGTLDSNIATIGITINPVNDRPVLTGGGSLGTIAEDTPAGSINGVTVSSLLSGKASDVDGDTLGIAVIGLGNPAKGTYQYSMNGGSSWVTIASASVSQATLLSASALLRFVPKADVNGPIDVYYVAWDGTYGNAGDQVALAASTGPTAAFSQPFAKATLTITPVNDAPVLTTGTPRSFGSFAEDTGPANIQGATVSSLISGRASDVDGDTLGIAIVSVGNPAKGTYQYSLNNGSTWLPVGSVSETNALLLGASAKVRFVPNANFNGTVDLYYRAWDKTQGSEGAKLNLSGKIGDTGTASVVFQKATCTVTPVNDAPVLVTGTPRSFGTIAEDTAPASIPGAMVGSLISGRASDVDGDALGIAIISVGQPGKGTYQYSVNGGSTWLNVDSVSESNALLLSSSAKVRFLPNADFNGTVDLYFRAWDGTQGAEGTKLNLSGKIGSPGTASVVFDKATCTVTPVNDAPQFTPQSYGPIGYVRGQAAGPAVFPDITVKDVDNTDFRRGVLQVTGLQSGDAISASGRFSFAGQFVLYTPDNQAAIQLGTRSGGAGSDLTITLSDNANPSQDLVQRLIRSFRFTSTGNAGARNLSLTLTDTAGDASNSVTRTVNVS